MTAFRARDRYTETLNERVETSAAEISHQIFGFFILEAEKHVCMICFMIQGLKLHRSDRERHDLLKRIKDTTGL